jgi:hypothetical protein
MPIYATIDFSCYEVGKEPTEMAIYVDGVCKGAEKITGSVMTLKTYIMDDPNLDGKVVEFKFWSPIKSVPETHATYQIWDQNNNTYVSQSSLFNGSDYARVYLKPSDQNTQEVPVVTALSGNYPNPFNPETIIRYSVLNQSKVSLDIFNVKGQKIKTLVNETEAAGFYSSIWDGKDENGHLVSSGVYFYRLNADKKSLTKKMILLK